MWNEAKNKKAYFQSLSGIGHTVLILGGLVQF